jgi:hypothetical protein
MDGIEMNWDLIVEYLQIYKGRLIGISDPVVASRICQATANELGKDKGWTEEVFRVIEIARNHWDDLDFQIEGIRDTD